MSTLNNYSPLRYPGGKSAIADFFYNVLSNNGINENGIYCEPFAGGAGIALTLLLSKKIKRIIINDMDICIASFWKSLLYDPLRFIYEIKKCEISIKEWEKHRNIYDNANSIDITNMDNMFTIGFSTFFLNRTNRSGILPKAGPIGGRQQNGIYKLDIRFNKEMLIKRIKKIIPYINNIKFTSLDAIEFMETIVMEENDKENLFIYLDPPYYHRGKDLYLNFYKADDHFSLAQYMNKFNYYKWIMTYDDCNEIREIYGNLNVTIHTLNLRYTLNNNRKAHEILISPMNINLPEN